VQQIQIMSVLEFMKIMGDEISRLDNFITGFLSTSIQDMGTGSDINAVIKKIEIYTSFQALARNIRCQYAYGLTPPARISPFQLEQAVLNVINNAMDAMPSGGALSVRTALERKNPSWEEWTIIEVSDTGTGMDVNGTIPSISDTRAGRGFGLFITREILQYCGGRMEIRSEKGLGTTVRLCLPASEM
jgi:two-component system nitrogen regulation sensor histidine kinase GlnL